MIILFHEIWINHKCTVNSEETMRFKKRLKEFQCACHHFFSSVFEVKSGVIYALPNENSPT